MSKQLVNERQRRGVKFDRLSKIIEIIQLWKWI